MKIYPVKDKIFPRKYINVVKNAFQKTSDKKLDRNINCKINDGNNFINKAIKVGKRIKKEIWDMLDGIV